MEQEEAPATVNYLIQYLIKRGYILAYIRIGGGLTRRKVVISGIELRVEITILDPTTYNVTYFVNKTEDGKKRPYIKVNDFKLDELRNTLEYVIEEFVMWVYGEDSFIYALSKTTNKIVRIG